MLYTPKLNSFDKVAAWYAKTKPIKSKNFTLEQDVRPIGERRRQWERIIKISDTCYALSCGGSYDPVFCWGYREDQKAHPLTPEEVAMLAPIVWRKHKDGTETVSVRNGTGECQHNHIYAFLDRALPRELRFKQTRYGVQYVYNRSAGTNYFLEKGRTVPRHVMEYVKKHRGVGGGWIDKWYAGTTLSDDGCALTFKRNENGAFTFVGVPPKEKLNRYRVDVATKKDYRKDIEELYIWAMTMYPLMRETLRQSSTFGEVSAMREEAKKLGLSDVIRHSWHKPFEGSEHGEIRKILQNTEHPLRHAFGMQAMREIDETVRAYQRDTSDQKELSSLCRRAYTRWINRVAGFGKTIEGETE